jgi:hypothetical protein
MKLIEGVTLADLLTRQPDTFTGRGRLTAAFEQIAQGLAFAH